MDLLLTHTTALEALRSTRLRWLLERRERCDALGGRVRATNELVTFPVLRSTVS